MPNHVKHRAPYVSMGLAMLLTSACAASAAQPTGTTMTSEDSAQVWPEVTDPTAIPLGDGLISTEPAAGSLYSCKTDFGGRGAPHGGPWIEEEAGTWDSTTKLQVEGSNSWPQATYQEIVEADRRVILADNVPTEQVTGTFPIAESDPAHEFDPNPNAIEKQTIELDLPTVPEDADGASCVRMGAVGVLKNGVYLYNAIDAAGGDAVANETQDVCDGHPDGVQAYHYHDIPSCLLDATPAGASTLVGYALDGYGIYVEKDSEGNLPTNSQLDECHGRTSTVTWDGEEQEMYHYSATMEYPYTVGCFRGDPVPQPDRDH